LNTPPCLTDPAGWPPQPAAASAAAAVTATAPARRRNLIELAGCLIKRSLTLSHLLLGATGHAGVPPVGRCGVWEPAELVRRLVPWRPLRCGAAQHPGLIRTFSSDQPLPPDSLLSCVMLTHDIRPAKPPRVQFRQRNGHKPAGPDAGQTRAGASAITLLRWFRPNRGPWHPPLAATRRGSDGASGALPAASTGHQRAIRGP